ncbi:MAG TPA: caspase family protein, partial [Solirubrobacterales bacterium]|nr:caspase family protein [Solirubrobacterales bacterium]
MAAVRSALIIANDDYEDPKLRKLRAPAQDAEELGRVLRDPAIGDFDVEVSTNEPEHVVRRKIARFFDGRRPDDLLLLHISSHGLKDDSGRLYFAASDTEVDHLDATAVWADFVNRQMTNSRSRRIVLLLDCCYSGAFARGMTARAGDAIEVRERFEGSGRAVLTASSAMEYSFEGDELSGEGNPSVFTSAVVKALETGEADRDGDHWISVDELYDYVHDQVQEITPKQTPGKWVFDLRGDLYIAKSSYSGGDREGAVPQELEAASESPLAYVREGAAHELGRLLESGRAGVAEAARAALERLVDDDSRRVSEAAKSTLASAATPARVVRPSSPPTTVSPAVSSVRRRRVGLAAALIAGAVVAAVLGIAGVFSGGAALPKGAATFNVSSPSALAIGAGGLWVADFGGNAISRIDPRSGRVRKKPIPVGQGPAS